MQELDSFIKKVTGKLSDEENLAFDEWLLTSKKNKKLYEDFLFLIETGKDYNTIHNVDLDKAWLKVKSNVDRQSNGKYKYLNVLKYAAIFIIFLTIGYLSLNDNNSQSTTSTTEDIITLTLDDGSTEKISSDGKRQIFDKNGNLVTSQSNGQLTYKSDTKTDEELTAYNELTIPYGKRFEVVLSDGTRVFLNAGSKLKYPTKFINTQDRKVYLTGEAFFEVVKNSKNPFVVNIGALNVQVLGTKFNVSAYPEENKVTTVLVDGKVALLQENKTAFDMSPNFKAEWSKSEREINYEKVKTNIYTSWRFGQLVFINEPFEVIKKKLERHYNIMITNNYGFLDNETFTGSFEDETINEVLGIFKEDTFFDYQILDNKITITKPKKEKI